MDKYGQNIHGFPWEMIDVHGGSSDGFFMLLVYWMTDSNIYIYTRIYIYIHVYIYNNIVYSHEIPTNCWLNQLKYPLYQLISMIFPLQSHEFLVSHPRFSWFNRYFYSVLVIGDSLLASTWGLETTMSMWVELPDLGVWRGKWWMTLRWKMSQFAIENGHRHP